MIEKNSLLNPKKKKTKVKEKGVENKGVQKQRMNGAQ